MSGRCGETDVKALAHVTGGGIEGNLRASCPRACPRPDRLGLVGAAPVFGWLARHVDEEEARRVFNLGIGYCAVVPDPAGGR